MAFAKIRTEAYRNEWSYVDADRVIRVGPRDNGYGSYMLEGETRWTDTYESLEDLVRKIEEAKST